MRTSVLSSVAALAALVSASSALAHIGYTGRNFNTLALDGSTVAINGQSVSSGFGWADATDADYGDSHRGRFFRFTLAGTASVSISVQRNNDVGTGPDDSFLPGFSLYLGLGHLSPFQGSHDTAALSIASRPGGTEGSFRALTDWSIGNDPTYVNGDPLQGVLHPADLRSFTYVGHAADGTSANYGAVSGISGDGLADGFVTGTFHGLAAGDYSIFVGGADYARQGTETGPTFPTYGVNVSVSAIPEPSAFAALAGCAALGLAALRRRRPAR
jgi:hypothetical protein